MPHLRRILFVSAAMVLAAVTAFASDLGNYAGRVRTALAVATELSQKLDENAVDRTVEASGLERMTSSLPPREKVDAAGSTVEVDNRWLHDAVRDFRSAERLIDRQRQMSVITERLAAVEYQLTQLEDAESGERTKDEDKRKLAEILKREEYQKPEPKESPFQRWLREFLEWLESKFPRSDIQPGTVSGMPNLAAALQILIYAIIAIGIGFLLYKLLPFFSERFRRREKTGKADRVILGERIGAEESSADIFDEAERLARAGELRMAIRKGYVAVLCELADRNVIGLARHKTNRDYLRDLRSREPLLTDVRMMTGEFERHWYGAHPTDETDWERFRGLYKQAIANAAGGAR